MLSITLRPPTGLILTKTELYKALQEYNARERRFGRVLNPKVKHLSHSDEGPHHRCG